MSSLEISDLTEKRHDNVIRDIRNMLGKLEKAEAQIWSTAFLPGPNNSSREVEIANLPRDLTETLITGYSIPLRHAVVVRLRQLEEQVAKPIPVANLNDPAALLCLLLGYDHIRVSIDRLVERGVIQAPAVWELRKASGQVS